MGSPGRAQPREQHAASEAIRARGSGSRGVATEIRHALASLPRRQREAVLLRFLLDLSVEDTAQRMGCAAGTVRALTAQGVGRLRLDHRLAELTEPTHD